MDLCDIPIPEGLDGRTLVPVLRDGDGAETREDFLGEFHGLRFLYSQRSLVTGDGWKYIFTPGDDDELYNLESDPWEQENLLLSDSSSDLVEGIRDRVEAAMHNHDDPLKDCFSKFRGHWYTGSGQVDASKFFDDSKTS